MSGFPKKGIRSKHQEHLFGLCVVEDFMWLIVTSLSLLRVAGSVWWSNLLVKFAVSHGDITQGS